MTEDLDFFGVWYWLVLATVATLIGFTATMAGGGLVVKKLFHSSTPREDGVYVEIVGRKSGFWSWLLALLGIDPTTELRVRYTRLEFFGSSIFGFSRDAVPIDSVATVCFGVTRPWLLALNWLAIFLAGAYGVAELGSPPGVVVLVVVGVIVAILVFVLRRERVIGVTDVTGKERKFPLKRSVIEGVEITEQTLDEISRIILALLDVHKNSRPMPAQ